MKKKRKSKEEARERFLAEVRKARAGRSGRGRLEETYRARALEVLPWVCAKCGRDFEGKELRSLTVHHKDHDHTNNPPDGSNWELLCVWCHDDEHGRHEVAESYRSARPGDRDGKPSSTHRPFADLDKLLGGEGE